MCDIRGATYHIRVSRTWSTVKSSINLTVLHVRIYNEKFKQYTVVLNQEYSITGACWSHQEDVTFLKFHSIIINSISFLVTRIFCRPNFPNNGVKIKTKGF